MLFNILWFLESFHVTYHQATFIIAQMHAVAVTIAEETAVGTLSGALPVVGAVRMIAIFPHIHEVVLIYITLIVVGTDACAGSNGTIRHHGTNGDACLTRKRMVANHRMRHVFSRLDVSLL